MFKNHLKIAWRALMRDKQFTFLNVLGLSIGIACALLIYLWVDDELSFDKFFKNNDRVYQVMEKRKGGGDLQISDESSGLLNEVIKLQEPGVEYAAAVAPADWFQKFTLSANEKNIKASGQYAGRDYFSIFSFNLVDGERNRLLTDKNSIVISDELADKLFGTTKDLIGKSVRFQHEKDFFISGVFEKLPYHSSQKFDFVLSFEYYYDSQSWVKSWNNTGPHNFLLLKKGVNVAAFNKRIADIITKSNGDSTRNAFIMPFSDNYLQNTFLHGSRTGGKIAYVKLFSLIAVFILIIACINFMNLSTAKASRRMKEVGVRKVVGSGRGNLIFQFLSESLLLTTVAMLIAVCIAWLLLPQFNVLTGKEIILHFSPSLILSLICITLFTGLLSGSYPAIYLSRFKPLAVLKGRFISSFYETMFRKGLVVFQFTLSVILIVAVLIIYKQVRFIQSTNPGYNKDNIVRFDSEGKLMGNEDNFITELKKIPGVSNVTYTFNNMVGRNYGTNMVTWDGKDPKQDLYFEGFGAGPDFVETMGMEMKQGRSFSKEFGNESSKVVLNEAATRAMHLSDAVGKNIRIGNSPYQVIGIVKDFHFESLHEQVKPAYFEPLYPAKNPWVKFMVKIKGDHQKSTIDEIQRRYEAYNPGFPFVYNFLDDAYQKQYESESRVAILSKCFSALAIFISCLGLFGLAAFTAQKRQKEIGIRKVVGASTNTIMVMLSKDFLKLTILSIAIAFPVSWWAMNKWLQGFAYRAGIGGWIFVLAASFVILITLLTVSFQSIRAAIANPVKSLRTE